MIDHVALLPVYAVAASAVLVLVADLMFPGRRSALLVLGALGPLAGGVLGFVPGVRRTFCVAATVLPGGVRVPSSCSFATDRGTAILVAVFCLITLVVLGVSGPAVRSGSVPAGEYTFLLLCSLTGAVV
ncbi:MAG: NADH-quinone oxidoreductase subunit, partial [Cryptosporangiaceae bacterium]|nr:NADH-quinone oxidoreductase subunit [Cryptosporangiaceae bacterium]